MFGNSKTNTAPIRQPTRAPSGKAGAAGLSFIGPDVLVSGDLTTASQIHVDGRIDGNVRCDFLIQGESGTIAGNIIADQVRIAGLVDGTIKARIVELEPSARVTGDVTYETLNITAGATIDGRLARSTGSTGAAGQEALATLIAVADTRPALPALDKPAAAAAA